MSCLSRYGAFRARAEAFALELPSLGLGNVEALHRTRVASRRLRELLPLLELDRDTSRTLDRRLRKVIRHLGAVRELDVLMLLIEELQRNQRYSPASLQRLSMMVGRVRDTARKRLAAKLPTAKLERLANRLKRVAQPFELDEATTRRPAAVPETRAWLWALDARLARRAASLRSAVEVAGGLYVPARLHDVRIALKKLRYAAELSGDVGHRRTVAAVAVLKQAQDLLGRLHDLDVLVAWGREVQVSLSPPDLSAWKELGALVQAVEDDCRRLHAGYMRDRGALIAIVGRMEMRAPHAAASGHQAAG